jgi:hypothetical protein
LGVADLSPNAATLEDNATIEAREPAPHELEPLLGTLDATTLGHAPAARSWLSRTSPKLALGVTGALALAAALTWSAMRLSRAPEPRPTAEAVETIEAAAPPAIERAPSRETPPAEHQQPVGAPSASASGVARSAAPAPAIVHATLSPRSRPSAAEPLPNPPEAAAPKKLPGGILDQERAPF